MKVYNLEQRTPEWLLLKKGKIGSTRLKQVLSKNNLPLIYELLSEEGIEEIEPTFQSEAMRWGVDMEPIAIHEYQKISGLGILQSGWWESDFSELVGLSPDGANLDFTHAIEIKAPNTKTHVEYIIGDRIPTAYKNQILMYFIVNEKLETLDFISFDPRYQERPIWIKRTSREELEFYIDDARAGLEKFLEKLIKYRGMLND